MIHIMRQSDIKWIIFRGNMPLNKNENFVIWYGEQNLLFILVGSIRTTPRSKNIDFTPLILRDLYYYMKIRNFDTTWSFQFFVKLRVWFFQQFWIGPVDSANQICYKSLESDRSKISVSSYAITTCHGKLTSFIL